MYNTDLKQVVFTFFLAFVAGFAGRAQADQWFFFDPFRLEAEIRFDGYRTDIVNDQGQQPDSGRELGSLQLEERISLVQDGYAIDPRISNFSIRLEPVFRQGRETQDNDKDRTRGKDLDYNINLGFLQGALAPVDFNLNTYRTTSSNDLAFGSRNKSDIEAHEVLVNWKNGWFPLTFGYRSGSYLQEFGRIDGLLNRRDEDRSRIRLLGRSSKLQLTLDSEDVDDNVNNRDFRIDRLLLNHHFSWGRGSRLYSDIRVFDRQGFNAYRQLSWSERLNIHHLDNLESRTTYRYFSQRALTDTTTHEGQFELRHRLYSNLESSVRAWGRSEESDTQDRTEYEAGFDTNYSKRFDFGAVTAGLYGDYRVTDRVSRAGLGEVIDEEQTASLVQPIVLQQQYVVRPSIIVAAEDGFVYSEGFDYEVRDFGGVFTEIRIFANGRISEGELLLTSYTYEFLPSAEFTSLSTGYTFSYIYRWFRFYHNGYRHDHRLQSGSEPPPDRENRSTGVDLSFNLSSFVTRLRAEARYRLIGGFETRDVVLGQSFGFNINNRLSINASGNQVFTNTKGVVADDPFRDPGQPPDRSSTDYYAFDVGLAWFALPNLSVAPSVGYWRRKEETEGAMQRNVDRRYFSADLRISWVVRQLTMNFHYNHNASDIDGTERVGDRVYFSVRRVFR